MLNKWVEKKRKKDTSEIIILTKQQCKRLGLSAGLLHWDMNNKRSITCVPIPTQLKVNNTTFIYMVFIYYYSPYKGIMKSAVFCSILKSGNRRCNHFK